MQEVDPFAHLMVSAYGSTAVDARAFKSEYGMPPTRMDRSHRFRSIVQAQVGLSDRYVLHPEYMESGRVQVTDRETQRGYLIRSRAALDIEAALVRRPEQLALFEGLRRQSTDLPDLLAYNFERSGMRLWSCATRKVPDGRRLVPAGGLDPVGFWTFDSVLPPPHGGGEGGVFDQGIDDPFDDLGDDLGFGEAGDL